jgi:hypothetical protein
MGWVAFLQLYGIRHIPGQSGCYYGAIGVILCEIITALFLPAFFGFGKINETLRGRPLLFTAHRSNLVYLFQIMACQAQMGLNQTMRVSPIGMTFKALGGLIFANVFCRYFRQTFIFIAKKTLQSRILSINWLETSGVRLL